MRHLASLAAGAVVAPAVWLLLALGQSQSTETLTGLLQGGKVRAADLLPAAANLGAAALLLGLLATLRISPLGPLVAAAFYLSVYVTVYLSPGATERFVAGTVDLGFITVPPRMPFVNGTLFVLGGALLMAVVSMQRWRRWPGTAPNMAQPQPTVPDGTGPDGTGPNGAGPDGAGPDGTGPDGTGPDEVAPDVCGDDVVRAEGAWDTEREDVPIRGTGRHAAGTEPIQPRMPAEDSPAYPDAVPPRPPDTPPPADGTPGAETDASADPTASAGSPQPTETIAEGESPTVRPGHPQPQADTSEADARTGAQPSTDATAPAPQRRATPPSTSPWAAPPRRPPS